jgi:RNA polymerase sigma-70 factor (ECF subfamily)
VADDRDEIIMQNVKEGNLSEMSVLFERYHLRLYNFFIRMGINKDMSRDMTQNLFYRMIRHRHTYKNGSSVKSWIFQIARNLHFDYRRQQKRSEDIILMTDTYPNDVVDSEEGYSSEEYERLELAIMSLTDEQREIIVLSRYMGFKYEEISTITSQSVAAIKVIMHRALKQLRGIYFKQT